MEEKIGTTIGTTGVVGERDLLRWNEAKTAAGEKKGCIGEKKKKKSSARKMSYN